MRVAVAVVVLSIMVFPAGDAKPGTGETAARAVAASKPDRIRAAAFTTDSPASCSDARRAVVWYRGRVNDWNARHDAPRARTAHAERSPGCAYVRWSARLWLTRARQARRAYERWWRSVQWPWIALARCESGVRWTYHGLHDGALQFHPGTWSAYRRAKDPPFAYLASPAQQIHVAERVLAAQGWGAWPVCSYRIGAR